MTRILVQRGGGASSNPRSYSSSSARVESEQGSQNPLSALKDEEIGEEVVQEQVVDSGVSDNNKEENYSNAVDNFCNDQNRSEGRNVESEKSDDDDGDVCFAGPSGDLIKGLRIFEVENEVSGGESSQIPPPPPIPGPGPVDSNMNPIRRAVIPPPVPCGSIRPSSPCRSRVEDGYNSADEHNPSSLISSSSFSYHHHDSGRERQFELDIRRVKGLEVRRMLGDGNCLFRAIADQVYGDPELYDLTRQMCVDYMERERDHFAQFITEGFTSYCKRKRRGKVYGNNVEIQAFAEMYNRPIHIHSYSAEPINIFHGNYDTDSPPIRLSYHHGNHYNSLMDPRRVTVGAGLGFSSFRGTNMIDKDQVKAAIKAQQDQQIDNALLAEGRLYSDIELTEKEIERMVMAASRAEFKQQQQQQQLSSGSSRGKDSSTSSVQPEPSSSSSCSGGEPSSAETNTMVISSSGVQVLLSMGFSYMQAMEAYTIFGDDVDSMLCYLLETGNTISSSSSGTSSSRSKGKATE